MDVFHGHRDVRVTIDSVATGNMIRHWRETPWMSNYIKCSVRPAVRWLFSASGGRRDTKNLPPWHHRLYIRGTCCRGSWCRSACRDPFYGERERECYLAMALSTHTGPRPHPVPSQPFAEPLYSVLLILPKTVWPWEFLEVQLPDDAPPDSEYALEPRTDAPTLRNLKPSQLWPQSSVVSSVVRGIRIPNLSTEHLTLKHHEHFCQVTPVFEPKEEPPTSPSPTQRLLPRSLARIRPCRPRQHSTWGCQS